MCHNKQFGFTLLELMAAMVIIAVLSTLGFQGYKKYRNAASRIQAHDVLKHVGNGLDDYFLRHGVYPTLENYESMVNASSPLVKEDCIPVNLPGLDPWNQPYVCVSSSGTYKLMCIGDINNKTNKAILIEPGKLSKGALENQPDGNSDDRQ